MADIQIPGPATPTAATTNLLDGTTAQGRQAYDPAKNNGAGYDKPLKLPTDNYVAEALDDGERLLKFASETGVILDPGIQEAILRARAYAPEGWNQKTAGDLLTALAQLAAKLRPVTAESLKAYERKDEKDSKIKPTLRNYKRVAGILGLVILFFSSCSFLTTAMSNSIRAKIDTANGLAAKLHDELGTPPPTNSATASTNASLLSQPPPGVSLLAVTTDLQQYAATIRDINSQAQRLNRFIFGHGSEWYLSSLKDPQATNAPTGGSGTESTNATNRYSVFQLPVGLPNLWDAETERTTLYQHVRLFGVTVVDEVSTYYGAFGSCILPMLYALFGTCAYLLHNYERQMKIRAFDPASGDTAHFFVAAICGMVVGLFNINLSQGPSASPLAIAFLVGYAVDVFFSFLEGLRQTFTKGKDGA